MRRRNTRHAGARPIQERLVARSWRNRERLSRAWSCRHLNSSGVYGCERVLLELRSGLFRSFSKFNERRPAFGTVFLIGSGRKADPLVPVLHVPRAVADDDADVGQLQIYEAAKGI